MATKWLSLVPQLPKDDVPRRSTDACTKHGSGGYVWEWCPRHPAAKLGWVAQHRLEAELSLGRFLTDQEVVHHKDHDRANNSLDNLEVFESQEDHMAYHQSGSKTKDPLVVEMVRAAAGDPTVAVAGLGMSPTSVRKICVENKIPWVRREKYPNARELTEESVREALLGRSTIEAAALLKVHVMTLYNRFPSLLTKRSTPGRLDPLAPTILAEYLSNELSINQLAAKYGVSEGPIVRIIHQARESGAIPGGAARRRTGPRNRKPAPLRTEPYTDQPSA